MSTKSEKAKKSRSKTTLPGYTRGEELFHMISHIVGGGFALSALLLCLTFAAWRHNVWGLAGGAVYGTTMILLYTMSSIYHGLIPERPKKVFRVIDHCAIFFLIAGSYTPIAFCALRVNYPLASWLMFAFIWAACALGVTLTAVNMHKFRIFSMICYVGLGWCVLVLIKPVLASMPLPAFILLVAGGVVYTLGSVLYGLGKKHKYMHSVFHMFVLLGSVLHFIMILKYMM